jgi:hypothetical protein
MIKCMSLLTIHVKKSTSTHHVCGFLGTWAGKTYNWLTKFSWKRPILSGLISLSKHSTFHDFCNMTNVTTISTVTDKYNIKEKMLSFGGGWDHCIKEPQSFLIADKASNLTKCFLPQYIYWCLTAVRSEFTDINCHNHRKTYAHLKPQYSIKYKR